MAETHSIRLQRHRAFDWETARERCLARGRDPWSVLRFFAEFEDEDSWAEVTLTVSPIFNHPHAELQ